MACPRILIACRVFEDELRHLLPPNPDVQIIWLDAALHADLDRLEQELSRALAQAVEAGAEVQLFLGAGCHTDIIELAQKVGAKLSPVKNCLEAFVGPQQKELEEDRTMLMTPGWIRAWPDIMRALGWDKVDVRINLGRYNRILLLEPGVNPLSDEEILAFFDLTQVPIEIRPLDLGNFQQLIDGMINQK
ncbi:MAG: DUF1638 domain-containing protein [Desulfobacca sp.]|uniref:DUF1638 domain-containing protein n=1 Tax=Desulfobacca sp. TaxID=2067990 RepID=UPI004049F2FA